MFDLRIPLMVTRSPLCEKSSRITLMPFMNLRLRTALLVLALFSGTFASAQEQPGFTRTEDVIYGHKSGMALTLDVFEPEKKNGAAIFFVASFGFSSNRDFIQIVNFLYKPLLDHGYTIFAVVHGSQPHFIVPEIQEDVHRAVRYVRHNAARWGVDPRRFGITGGSAGGHLSLVIGTQGGPGKATSEDPVERESSAVQAVACFMPITDLLNWSMPKTVWMDFEPMREFAPAFGPMALSPKGRQELGRKISPIYFLTSKAPPTLIIHGSADKLVPLYQSQRYVQKCQQLGAPCELIVKQGAGHGPDFGSFDKELARFNAWFDEHLLGIKTLK
jgi:acetyl esterase/lipase